MKRIISVFLVIIIALIPICSYAKNEYEISTVINDTSKYLYENVSSPQVGSIGGEWTILALARGNYAFSGEYINKYLNSVMSNLKSNNGILHEKKYTEYSRVIMALTSLGISANKFGDYDLLLPLGDYEKTVYQGVNGAIWALIALDCNNYPISTNPGAKVQATRQMYVDKILDSQLEDGGFSISGEFPAEPDTTAMALQALSKYKNDKTVNIAIEKGVDCLSKMQNSDGGYSYYLTENSETIVQVIVALGELGISITDDRFVKNSNTLFDNLMLYYKPNCGFSHTLMGTSNIMATEQGLYGLVSLERNAKNKNSLYNMTDAKKIDVETIKPKFGLSNKHIDIKYKDITDENINFLDIKGNNEQAITQLGKRGIVNGKSENLFFPNDTISRCEFATIIVKALGFELKNDNAFSDVPKNEWFSPYVSTAAYYGIVNGVSDGNFNPFGIITKEEACVILSRCAKLCGMENNIDEDMARDILASFTDYMTISPWAKNDVGFCVNEKIVSDEAMDFLPKTYVKRCEMAQMVYNLLSSSNLIEEK